jgi:hypothetical protein
MVYDRDHVDDEVVVEREGTGLGTILGIILAIVVVLAIVWFFFLGGMGNGTNNGGDTTIQQEQVQPLNPVDGGGNPVDGSQP